MLRTILMWTMVLLAGTFIAGCKNEEAPKTAKPKVVQRKISLPSGKAKALAPAASVAAAKKTIPPIAKAAPPKPNAAVGALKKSTEAMPSPGSAVKASSLPSKAATPPGAVKTAEKTNAPPTESLGNLITQAESLAGAAYRPRIYHPEGKIDPFMPLFQKQAAAPTETATPKIVRREPKTPLEMLALSQLRLVATMESPDGRWALVEESSGKGYVVKKGTYIGLKSGVVTAIKRDRIIIEEKVEDLVGHVKTIKQVMKINRPPGEI